MIRVKEVERFEFEHQNRQCLNGNKISDVKLLVGLTNLHDLWLKDNPIAVKICPVKPSVCEF
jgi:hypothetical protein